MYLKDSRDKDYLIGWAVYGKLKKKYGNSAPPPQVLLQHLQGRYGYTITRGAREAIFFYARLDLDDPLPDLVLWQEFYAS